MLTDIYNGDKNMLELLRDLGRQIKSNQKVFIFCVKVDVYLPNS